MAEGYGVGRLWAALETAARHEDEATRLRAAAKAERWTAALVGIASGEIAVGSRTPVDGTPAWVTLEVLTGGFASGRHLAEQPLTEAELERRAPGPGTDRERVNRWYLSDPGQAELLAALAQQRYRIDLPEHAALPVVALLLERGHAEAALDLVAELSPFLDRLRFTPEITAGPQPLSPAVHLDSVGEVARILHAIEPPAPVVAMRATLGVWNPLLDDLVELWSETVEGDPPRLVAGRVEGGRPARRYPDGWVERGKQWLIRCAEADRTHPGPTRHRHPRSNFARLRASLEHTMRDDGNLGPREAGWVRRALANVNTRHGGPGNPRLAVTRAEQGAQVAAPTHAAVAELVAVRLDALPPDSGLTTLDNVISPPDLTSPARPTSGNGLASPENAGGAEVPPSLIRKVRRALEAPVEELITLGVIGSGEVLARVLPHLTAAHVAADLRDPVLAGLQTRTYTAFRRRRGLLLLHLQHQVRFEELPWITALDPFRAPTTTARDGARRALRSVATLAVSAFPERIVPNPLLTELRALARAADVELPLVEEVAADIFMGTFTAKWSVAAAAASDELTGSLYANYYDLPAPQAWDRSRTLRPRWGKRTSARFDELCQERAKEAGPGLYGVAASGAVIEQSQILTTQNLTALVFGLDLRSELPDDLADRVLRWIVERAGRIPLEEHAALIAVKNLAYAWRQAVFFLSVSGRADESVAWLAEHAPPRLRPAVRGLEHVVAGGRFGAAGTTPDGGRRLLGWTVGAPHWLLAEPPGARTSR